MKTITLRDYVKRIHYNLPKVKFMRAVRADVKKKFFAFMEKKMYERLMENSKGGPPLGSPLWLPDYGYKKQSNFYLDENNNTQDLHKEISTS